MKKIILTSFILVVSGGTAFASCPGLFFVELRCFGSLRLSKLLGFRNLPRPAIGFEELKQYNNPPRIGGRVKITKMQEKSQDAARDRVTTNIRYTLLRIVPGPERVVEGREVVRDPRPL